MSDLPAKPSPSLVGALYAYVMRALTVTPSEIKIGADYANGAAVAHGYDQRVAMSAYVANSWIYACANAIATDMSGLPIVVSRGVGPKAKPDEAHPVHDLIAQPSSATTRTVLERQLWTDLSLSGSCWAIVTEPGGAAVAAQPMTALRPGLAGLQRQHPARMFVVYDMAGAVAAYEYRHAGTVVRYHPSRVLHVSLQTWQDDPRDAYGTGAAQVLSREIIADVALTKRSAANATSGRPSAIASPLKEGETFAPHVIQAFKEAISRVFKESDGGVAVLGGTAKIDILGWDSKELDVVAQRSAIRDNIIAAMGVPPTRVGIPTANYAQSQQQDLVYWQDRKGAAKMLDDELTRIARLFPRSDDVVVRHSFDAIDALQSSLDARLARAETLMGMGVATADALAYVGLADVPLPVDAPAELGPVQDLGLNGAQISGLLAILAAVSAGTLSEDGAVGLLIVAFPSLDESEARRIVGGAQSLPEPVAPGTVSQSLDDQRRAAMWRAWVTRSQAPAERVLLGPIRQWLREARRRTVDRAESTLKAAPMGVTKASKSEIDALVAEIWPTGEEGAHLRKLIGKRMDKVLLAALQATARDLKIKPRKPPSADDLVDLLVGHVTATTEDDVRAVLTRGLDEGRTSVQMAADLQEAGTFSPTRAMTIARTEATKATNAGHVQAIEDATAEGIEVDQMWLSSRDAAVRDSHTDLDGQVIAAGDKWYIGSDSASFPGDFNQPENTINCRCTVVPIVRKA